MVYLRTIVCSCVVLSLAGCGKSEPPPGNLVPVQGKITLTNGKPLPDGLVSFVPLDRESNLPAAGAIESDGSYKISTKGHPEAQPGKYRVVLTQGEDRTAWSAVPSKFYNRQKTPLEVEVAENKPPGGYDVKVQAQGGVPPGPRRDKPPD